MGLIIRLIEEIQAFTLLSCQALINIFRRPRYIKDTFHQMDEVGVKSTAIILLTGFFTGGVLALQSASSLKAFGAVNLTGQLVSVSLIKELGPVFSALMLSGRVGSGIASQLGSMLVTEQIDALESLSFDPITFLIFPRILASAVMFPLLVIIADFFGIIGSINYSDFISLYIINYTKWNETTINIICFMLLFISIVWSIMLIAKLITKILKLAYLGLLNRIFGALFGGIKWIVILSGIIIIYNSINQIITIPNQFLEESFSYNKLLDFGHFIFDWTSNNNLNIENKIL